MSCPASDWFARQQATEPVQIVPCLCNFVVVEGCHHDGKRDSFETGDLMFVAAGTDHRFEEFTDDLAV